MIKTSKYPFIKCLYPRRIKNPYTREDVVVACGRCEACQLQKSAMSTLKCRLESAVSEYTLFCTLTYDENSVPLMSFIRTDECLFESNKWKYIVIDDSNDKYYNGEILGEVTCKDIDFFALAKRSCNGTHYPKVAYLRTYDVQLFFKRLRKLIYNETKEKIRYYCVGEYGPKYLRPHWHFLLYTNSKKVSENLGRYISACWTYGITHVGTACGKGISYVAGYVNSNSSVPEILRMPATKPKSTHSIKMGEQFFKVDSQEIYWKEAIDFVRRSVIVGGNNAEFSLWRSMQNYYFPKCKGYATKSPQELYKSYTVILDARRITGFTRPYQIAKILTQVIRCREDCGLDKELSTAYNNLIDYVASEVDHIFLRSHLYRKDYWDKLQQKIYRILYCSAHFIDFVCNGCTEPLHMDVMLSCIRQFYTSLECSYIKEQMEQAVLIEHSHFPDDVKYLYTNMLSDGELDEIINTVAGRNYKIATLKNHSNSYKHKRMNDEFDFFNPSNLTYQSIN